METSLEKTGRLYSRNQDLEFSHHGIYQFNYKVYKLDTMEKFQRLFMPPNEKETLVYNMSRCRPYRTGDETIDNVNEGINVMEEYAIMEGVYF